MAFLFGKKKSGPADLVKACREALVEMCNKSGRPDKGHAIEEASKTIAQMKAVLYGDAMHEPNPEHCQSLATEVYSNDLLSLLVLNLPQLEFEAKKDVAQIFNNLLRKTAQGRTPAVDYIEKNQQILETLISGYDSSEIALNTGSMLRECLRHEPLARIVLQSNSFYNFFQYVEVNNFDVASDAFATFKDLLTQHKTLAAEFLEQNYDKIFELYTNLLKSANYVTRRQSLKLLGELLLDRANFNIMTRYISDLSNLKLMMQLLREKSKSIQFEAFHVFKVFVANPNKPKPILEVLVRNKGKLIKFLTNFQTDREDEQFVEEKAFLIKQIEQLA